MFIIFFGLAFALLGAASAAAIEAATVQQSSSTATKATSTATKATSTTRKVSSTVTYTSSSAPSSTSVGDGSTYTIDFINLTGEDNDYGFFLAPPLSPLQPDDKVWTNTWIAKNINNTVKMQIQFTNTFYALVGTAPEALSPNVSFTMEQSLQVSLGTSTEKGTTLDTDDYGGGYPVFQQPYPTPAAGPGTFQITTGDNFTYASNFVLGMGALGLDGSTVEPVGVIQMAPNLAYTVQPAIQFYVSQGSYIPGKLLDIGSVSAKAGFCDFVTYPACNTCSFIQNAHGDFSVNYTTGGSPCQ